MAKNTGHREGAAAVDKARVMFRPFRPAVDQEDPVPNPLRGAAAIVGAVDAVSPDGRLGRTDAQLEVEVIRAALDDAGLTIGDVDCVMSTNGMTASLELGERLGVRGRFTASTMTGGSSFEVPVQHAAPALPAGLCAGAGTGKGWWGERGVED